MYVIRYWSGRYDYEESVETVCYNVPLECCHRCMANCIDVNEIGSTVTMYCTSTWQFTQVIRIHAMFTWNVLRMCTMYMVYESSMGWVASVGIAHPRGYFLLSRFFLKSSTEVMESVFSPSWWVSCFYSLLTRLPDTFFPVYTSFLHFPLDFLRVILKNREEPGLEQGYQPLILIPVLTYSW